MEFPRATWVRHEHFDALSAAIVATTDTTTRRRLREIATILVQYTAQQVTDAGVAVALEARESPLVDDDLLAVKRLLAKGVQHNGVVPELDTYEVSRGLAVAADLLARADTPFAIDDLDCLEWSFTIAAGYDERNQADVRRVEGLVRKGLGLGPKLTFSPRTPEEIA